ncbi:MAG TPA: AraC family transcriptional regulator [Chryseolinea sp.]|nr:AraC family transcriptional regulator [Chryseolinea sp.]
MQMQHLLQPFEVENVITDHCPVTPHTHSFFELVFILDGQGSYVVNEYRYRYGKDDLFVIVPEYGHHTIVETTTSFLFIRFNLEFLDQSERRLAGSQKNSLTNKIEYIFVNQQRLPDSVDPRDRLLLRLLCTSILEESLRGDRTDNQLLHQFIKTMLMIIVKRIESQSLSLVLPEKSSIRAIIEYIHQHIRVPEALRVEAIAAHVNMSKNYVGEYFRKFHSKSLQQYITDYKFQLIEERLCRSDLRVGEIAFEFGFSGESHLTTAFRKYKGTSPMRYRKTILKQHSLDL